MTIDVQLNADDFRACEVHLRKYGLKPRRSGVHPYGSLLLVVCIGALVLFLLKSEDAERMLLPYGFGILVTIGWVYWTSYAQQRVNNASLSKRNRCKPYRISITSEGIKQEDDEYHLVVGWKFVRSLDETKQHFFFVKDQESALIVPFRSFTSESQRTEFLRFCRSALNS